MTDEPTAQLRLARSCLAALADRAGTFRTAMGYESVLLELDALHPSHPAPISSMPNGYANALYGYAVEAIDRLAGLGFDRLALELVLAGLNAAHELRQA